MPAFQIHLLRSNIVSEPHSPVPLFTICKREHNRAIRVILPDSMTLSVHLCQLLVASALLLCSSTLCLGSKYEYCLWNASTCGGFYFGYPFGQYGSGCGDPAFQLLSCDTDGHPRLNISGKGYDIVQNLFLGNNSDTTIIVTDNLWADRCNLPGTPLLWWSVFDFHIRNDTYTNLTRLEHCNESWTPSQAQWLLCGDEWYYFSSPETASPRICQTPLQLPSKIIIIGNLLNNENILEQGFDLDVNLTKNQICEDCLKSNGNCGYDIAEPTTFLCYYPEAASKGNRNKTAIILGCSIGALTLAAAIITLVLFLRYNAKRKSRKSPSRRNSNSKVEKFLKQYAYEMPTRYSQSQLKKITNNFAEKLGEGGYGVVYKGKLRNGALVAVKVLDRQRQSESTQFMNEVATIGRLHHVNLVRLLGYCFENPTSALVYEYMINGSLEKIIFAGKEKGRILTWEQLHSIALGTARGIAYLHTDCEKRIIHFDIKPHNILLDADFTPKVSDFGLAKLCDKGNEHISMSGARGTPGYVAPELCDLGSVTDKADVYSFGMLLLEIVGGRKNIDWKVSRSSQFYFPEWAFKLLESGELGVRLRRGGVMEADQDEEKTRRLTKIGLWCIQYNHSDRPSMSMVVKMLEGNADDVANPPLPLNSSSAAPENPLLSSTERSC